MVEGNEHWLHGGEFGERMKDPKPGERVDISKFRDDIKRGATDADLLDNHVACVAKYQRMIGFTRTAYAAKKEKLPAGSRKDMGIWIWGPTDTGKSTQVPVDVFDKGSNKWWDGYQDQPVVLLDDPLPIWNGACMGWLKQWIQEKPFNAEIKGGGAVVRILSWLPRFVLLTTSSGDDHGGALRLSHRCHSAGQVASNMPMRPRSTFTRRTWTTNASAVSGADFDFVLQK